MKNRKAKVIAGVFILLLLGITSCQKDNPSDPTQSAADREKFLGTWQGTSTGTNGTRNFNMTYTASNSAPEQILMSNFDGEGSNTYIPANVSGNSFAIVRTVVNGETIQGSGTYTSNTLSFTFTVDDGQTVDNRTGSAHR